jgi:cytochrome c-type biogenesis protein CcmF
VPIATVICILIAIGQFFKYKTSDGKEVLKKLLFSFVASLIIALAFHLYFSFDRVQHVLLLFATVFAVFANADYWLRTLKGKVNFSGASIAHMGLALLLLGALLSNAKSYFISRNILNIDLGKDFPNNENIMIREGDTLRMGDYYVTYKGKYKEGVNVFFDIDYLTHNQLNNTYKKEFTLKPIIQLNERMGNASEPATKRFFGMDIYTHITYADIEAITNEATSDEYTKPKTYDIKPGDTLMVSNAFVYFRGIDKNVNTDSLQLQEGDLAVYGVFDLVDVNKKFHQAKPMFIIKSRQLITTNTFVEELGLKFRFTDINVENGNFKFEISEKKSNKRDFVIMKAIVFPQINILWTGCILLVIGSWIAMRKRFKESYRE